MVEAASKVGWLSEEVRADTSLTIRETLQQSLYADRDILLPRMAQAGAYELFFLLAATDAPGAAALSKRILKQLHDPEHIEFADLAFGIDQRPLGKIGQRPPESTDACGERVAAIIQLIMNEEVNGRIAKSA